MKVSVVELKKHYGSTKAVDNISFEFASGQIFGFVGPNGAGKTTTMRILATLDEPTGGDAFVDGVSVTQYPERARKLIGFVPDTLPTHRDMSIHDYLDFYARAYGLKNPRRNRVLAEIEDFTNVAGIRDKALIALSKGMKQRVSVARALLHDPPVLILDEPANGLDPRARIELRELLKALTTMGKAILISSHILTELGEICDGVVIIEHGRMLRAGTIQEISKAHGTDGDALLHTVQIRLLGRFEEACKHLLEMPFVESATGISADTVEVRVGGSDETCCDLLANLIKAGYRVAEFRQRRADLEEIFMNVTKGEVQ
jgi:ABC-2 type transport system ATP-binding protein